MTLELFEDPNNRYWLSDEEVADLWPDAPADDLLAMLNAAAIEQLSAYAPASALEPYETNGYLYQPGLPDAFRLAQLMQVRNLYNAGRVSPAGDLGAGDFTFTPFPLTWQVQALLRPKRGRPVIG
ncbi:hypothetical protein [Herbiconiux sp. VKM Ac-2851]|uniref:hypothetical protein n=1 Tax=Herbiconiux sp. VKM Ac-2851 TaxID=2739025 RepID=UPI0015679258|nr:hypothetical protein [Herbiconiux sp. VKM Ac-2851]NQX34050.1 hypothetical protein [Herbiconiux sp. VKM Ac-2851]